MAEKVMIENKMKNKIEELGEWYGAYTVRFVDLDDTFWFDDKSDLQEFLSAIERERYFDKECRKGYFDYINEANETLRYHVESKRGTLSLIKDENLGMIG